MLKELAIEGIRCFRDEQRLPIRPVTLLVGENSTGKSTVLAMVRAAWDVASGAEPNFNEEPFDFGGYDSIAHYHGGQGKRVHSFELTGTFAQARVSAKPAFPVQVEGTFSDRAGQPVLSSWSAEHGDLRLKVAWEDHKILVSAKQGAAPIVSASEDLGEFPVTMGVDSLFFVRHMILEKLGESPTEDLQRRLLAMLPPRYPALGPRPIASAPIRSKPERTYDPKRGLQEPEGSHVPMELATLQATGPDEFDDLVKRVSRYGIEAGLFQGLNVKRLGRKPGDPFQVVAKVGRFAFNLRDVGYGVSQVLPILVDALRSERGQTFLLQQPEVHLHPRAQALLGTLLVEQAIERKHVFVVETHSDHLVDRVRTLVRDGRGRSDGLTPEQVSLLYFERNVGRVAIHRIHLDEHGNLMDAPSGYRSFFLEEERRLLGI